LSKPNIIIFNPDQWRADVLGHTGNPAALTPNLDEMVSKDAVSFSNAYCQSTICTPSRCSFMTGLYPHTRGHRTMHHMLHLEHGETHLMRLLKENGYYVWWSGKNDLLPADSDFSESCDCRFNASEDDYRRWGYSLREGTHGGSMLWRGDPNGSNYYSFLKGKLDKADKDVYFDNDWAAVFGAIDVIAAYEEDTPFCINLSLTSPHPPYCVEEPWFSSINRVAIPDIRHEPENYSGKASMLKGLYENQNLQSWDDERFRELRAIYYGMCSRLDYQFGMIVNILKKRGLYDNTAIFFFSDHGDYTGDYHIVEKCPNSFEDTLCAVPFIFKPPKEVDFSAGVTDEFIELIDFPATVFDLTKIDPGYDHFGISLLPLIRGDACTHREAVYCEGGRLRGEIQATESESLIDHDPGKPGLYYPRLQLQMNDDRVYHTKATMCRTKRYKYIKRLYEGDEFYDLINDPDEVHNVITDPEYMERIQEHKELMLDWYMRTCDVVPRDTDKRWLQKGYSQ